MYEIFDPRDGVTRRTTRTAIMARLITRRELRKTRAVAPHVGPKHVARCWDYNKVGEGF